MTRDRSQYAHRFSAKVTRATVVAWHLDSIARKVADGSWVPFITHLVQAKTLSEEDKEKIRRLLEE